MKWPNPTLGTKLFSILLGLTLLPLGLLTYLSDWTLTEAAEVEASRIGLGRISDSQFLGDALTDVVLRACMDTALDPKTTQIARHPRLADIQKDPDTSYFFLTYQIDLEARLRANSLLAHLRVQLQNHDYTTDTVDGTYPRRLVFDRPQDDLTGWRPDDPLTFRYRLPPFVSEEQGWIEATLNEVYLSRQLNPSGGWGQIGIASLDGRVISHPDKRRLGTRLGVTSPGILRQGYQIVDSGEGKVLVTWSSEWSQPWLWFGEFPLQALNEGLVQRRVLGLSFGLCLVLATLAVSWSVSRRFFRPVQDLARRVSVQLGEAGDEGDDLQILSRSFEALQLRENQLFRNLQSTREKTREAWLITALDGASPSSPTDLGDHFQCILVFIDDFARMERTHGELVQALQRVLLQAAIIALGEGGRSCHGLVRGEGRLVVVLDGAPESPPLDPGILVPLAQEVSLWLGHSLTFCVGPRDEGAMGLRRSWLQALELSERRFVEGTGRVFDQPAPEVPFKPLSVNQLQRVVAAVESGQSEAVTKALDQVGEHIRRHPGKGQGRTALYQLASSLAIWMAENGLVEEKILPGEGLFDAVSRADSLDQACADLKTSLLTVQQWRADARELGKAHIQRLLDYIWQHYREDCDVATVARGVGLSYSHVRRVFSDHVGETIVAHVNRIRIDDARHLLLNTDFSVEEVALAVGFRNTQSLQRYFHKFVGTSPGEYRRARQVPSWKAEGPGATVLRNRG